MTSLRIAVEGLLDRGSAVTLAIATLGFLAIDDDTPIVPVPTPTDRIVVVSAERRSITVDAEVRMVRVDAEVRSISVDPEVRSIEAEDT